MSSEAPVAPAGAAPTEEVAKNGGEGASAKEKGQTSADYYFDSYAHFGIHEEMLKDEVRTRSYQMAIVQNPHLFKDKVVLDVGSGTGILCMFAAQAGAKHVYGVECSGIIEHARRIVKDNGFEDRITLIQGKLEEITLPVENVDIIVSEWMGYFLFYESMLDTVIYARDKWLAPDGILLPDKARLNVALIEDADYRAEKIDFWDNVYGFNMSSIKDVALLEPLVDTVESDAVITNPCSIFELDINTVKKEDLSFASDFSVTAKRNDFCHAIISWFDISFSACHKPVQFSTGPHARYTHWKQTVFYTQDVFPITQGETLSGRLTCEPNAKNPRDLDIEIQYSLKGSHSSVSRTQPYRLR